MTEEGAGGDMPPALSEALLSGLEKKSWCDGHYKLIYKPDYPAERRLELYDLVSHKNVGWPQLRADRRQRVRHHPERRL